MWLCDMQPFYPVLSWVWVTVHGVSMMWGCDCDRSAAIHQEAPDYVDMSVEQEILETGIKVVDMLAPYCKGGKIGRFTVVSFQLKCVLATRDVCKRPWHLHHWNQHSISDSVIPHIAVYNAYGFVTEQINTSTVFVHVSDRVIGTGQTENTPVENHLAIFQGTCNVNIKTTVRMQRKRSFYSYKFQDDTFRDWRN